MACMMEIDSDMNMQKLKDIFKEVFIGKDSNDSNGKRETYICQMLRLDYFNEDDGSIDFSINVPLNAKVFNTFQEACEYGDRNNGVCKLFKGFWGEDYSYEDYIEVYCGYIVYETNDQNYHTYGGLPKDRRIVHTRFCAPSILYKLQKKYNKGGQVEMFKWAKDNL